MKDSIQAATIAKNVVNLYAGPDNTTEMVSQAILGQPAWVEKEEGGWSYIRTWDGYRGWAQSRWVLGKSYPSGESVVVQSLIANVFTLPDRSSEILTKAVTTTELETADTGREWTAVTLPDGSAGHIPSFDVRPRSAEASGDEVVRTAMRFVGVPYLWGGTTPFGIDCSGFVQLAYRVHGIALPRDAYMQAEDDRAVPIERDDLRAGDLLFFAGGTDCEKITHVGMAVGDGRFIHSSSGVGVNVLELNNPRYEKIYWGARRIQGA